MMVDMTELAKLLLLYGDKKKELLELEEKIADMVLSVGTTQTVGNVRATYSKGRKKYDWEKAALKAPFTIIDKHTKVIPESFKTDWKKVCKEAEITDIPVISEGNPSVSLKILDKV